MHVIAVVIGWWGYRAIETQQTELTARVLPVSTASQQSADLIAQVQVLAPQIPEINRSVQLDAFGRTLRELLQGVEGRLAVNQLDDEAVAARLRQADEALVAAVDAQGMLISEREQFEVSQRKALRDLEQLKVALEVYDAGTDSGDAAGRVLQETLRGLADWQALVLTLASLQDETALDETAASIARGIRQSVRALSRVGLLQQAPDLADRFLTLLEGMSEQGGPFESWRAQILAAGIVGERVSALSDSAAQLASRLSQLVDSQNLRAAAASRELGETLRTAEVALFVVSLSALLLSVLFVRFLVFRGVVAPLDALTRRTTDLASGDLSSPVPSPRFSELATIAEALKVFQRSLQRLARADEQLRRQNEKLVFANEELNRFAYAASHDLRSPLRGVKTLAGFVRDDFEGPMPEVIDHHLGRMEARLSKMEALLEDLLAYSRAGAEIERYQQVSLRAIVAEARMVLSLQEDLDIACEEGADEVYVPPLAVRQVLRNLIDNAIKHHDGLEPLRVRVKALVDAYWTRIEITDNGPGIPPAYRERVLKMFQTLKGASASQTSGMGLAMVERLVQRAGGRLEIAEPEAGRGTRVVLLLPAEGQPVALAP
jgi:signal transduction histidine kinase